MSMLSRRVTPLKRPNTPSKYTWPHPGQMVPQDKKIRKGTKMKRVFHALTLLSLAAIVFVTIIFPASYTAVMIS